MVTAPKCKVCGSAHFGATHVWPKVPSTPFADLKIVTANGPLKIGEPIVDIDLGPAKNVFVVVDTRPAPKRDRAAYMRAYRAAKASRT